MKRKRMILMMLTSMLFVSCKTTSDNPESDINNSPVVSQIVVLPIGAEVSMSAYADFSPIESSCLSGLKISTSFELNAGESLPYNVKVNLVDSEQRLRKKHPFSMEILGGYVALEQLTIVADKQLFGLSAGTPLNSHFSCSISDYMPYAISYPEGVIDLNSPMEEELSMDDKRLYTNIVPKCYDFNLVDNPDERYEEVTFSIRFKFINGTEIYASKVIQLVR